MLIGKHSLKEHIEGLAFHPWMLMALPVGSQAFLDIHMSSGFRAGHRRECPPGRHLGKREQKGWAKMPSAFHLTLNQANQSPCPRNAWEDEEKEEGLEWDLESNWGQGNGDSLIIFQLFVLTTILDQNAPWHGWLPLSPWSKEQAFIRMFLASAFLNPFPQYQSLLLYTSV